MLVISNYKMDFQSNLWYPMLILGQSKKKKAYTFYVWDNFDPTFEKKPTRKQSQMDTFGINC